MKCDIIIPVWNQADYTKDCIEAIIRNTGYPYRLVLIDNASGADTARYLEGLKDNPLLELELIRNEKNLGFVKAVNQGLKASSAPYVCVLNNDTIPGPGWLARMVEFAEAHEDIGLMNPLCNGHGSRPIEEYSELVRRNKDKYMEMNQCQGFCMLIKREVIDRVGFLDESFGMGCYDDTDYSMRAWKAGYRCASVHSAYVYHRENVSFDVLGRRRAHEAEGEKAFLRKWTRHLRVAISYNEAKATVTIAELLALALELARDWCWVNIFIFGDAKGSKEAVADASKKIGMPAHQNIKFSFLPSRFKRLQLLARILERSFGPKARKRYDLIIEDRKNGMPVLKSLHVIHKARVITVDFNENAVKIVKTAIDSIRITHNA